jgi:hypothetical protein
MDTINLKRKTSEKCNFITSVCKGWDQLIRGAGKDATELFNDIHR